MCGRPCSASSIRTECVSGQVIADRNHCRNKRDHSSLCRPFRVSRRAPIGIMAANLLDFHMGFGIEIAKPESSAKE